MECCFCSRLTDISALKDHPTLKYLNISYTNVSDISMLENVALERMVAMTTPIAREAQHAFDEAHPDCLSAWYGEQPYGYPWRYDAIPNVPAVYFSYYAHMRQLFLYGEAYYWNVKNSPYGPGYLALRE